MQPQVSIVVPAYNAETYLRQCMDALVGQTLQSIEIIAVNDGSTDATGAILAAYAARDSRVRVITKENSGYGASVNRGMREARGEYVGIIESDDWPQLHMFEKLYRVAKRNDCDLVKCDFFDTYETGESKRRNLRGFPYGRVFDTMELPRTVCIVASPWAALYRRSMLEQNEVRCLETPGAAFQDTGLSLKALFSARRCEFVREPLVHYRRDKEAASTNSLYKALAVCGEFAEIWRYLADRPQLEACFAPWLSVKIWRTYAWNYGRIAPELREGFLQQVRDEFLQMAAQEKLGYDLFEPFEIERVATLLEVGPKAFAELYPEGYEEEGEPDGRA